MRQLDASVNDGRLPADAAETVEGMLDTGPAQHRSWTARWAAEAGSDAYTRAFAKKLADPDNGHLTWTGQEADAWRTVVGLRDEQRAVSLTDTAGGFWCRPTWIQRSCSPHPVR